LEQALRRTRDLPLDPAFARALLNALLEAEDRREETLGPSLRNLISCHPVPAAMAMDHAPDRPSPPGTDPVESADATLLRSALLAPRIQWPRKDSGADLHGLWMHSLAVALASQALAKLGPHPTDPADAYYAGLLHDLGKIALIDAFPKAYRRVLDVCVSGRCDLNDYERDVLGIDHVSFGRRLAQQWKLPPACSDVIWMHHQPFEAIPQSVGPRRLCALVSLADNLARQAGIGFSGNLAKPRSCKQLAAPLEIPAHAVSDLARDLPEMLRGRLEPLQIGQTGSSEEVERLQAQANRALGAMLRRSLLETRQARGKVRILEGLCQSLPRSRHQHRLSEMLEICLDALAAVEAAPRPCIAYGLDTGAGEALLLRRHPDGGVQSRYAPCKFSASADPSKAGAGPAPEALSSLLEDAGAIEDWLERPDLLHLPLFWGNRRVGGLVVAAPKARSSSEAQSVLAELLGPLVGLALARQDALRLSEELAGASVALTATQDALAEQTTMRAVRQMAAGAAHELNTPLALISGRAQLMCDKARSREDSRAWQGVVDQAQRISDLISELMQFASPPAPSRRAVGCEDLLQRAQEAFLASNHPQVRAVSLEKSIGEDLPRLLVDPDQIVGVILELITNAANASADGGRILLSGQRDDIARRVLLRVEDKGMGMDEDTLTSCFTPFFSKQPAGRRRGLGLSLAKRTVENNGGSLWITSKPETGTIANVALPIADMQAL
jgi:putative nucleotidyltransferase with HDIG domain